MLWKLAGTLFLGTCAVVAMLGSFAGVSAAEANATAEPALANKTERVHDTPPPKNHDVPSPKPGATIQNIVPGLEAKLRSTGVFARSKVRAELETARARESVKSSSSP